MIEEEGPKYRRKKRRDGCQQNGWKPHEFKLKEERIGRYVWTTNICIYCGLKQWL